MPLTIAIFLLAVDQGQEEQGVAMVVHVAPAHAIERADQAIALSAIHQPIRGPANVVRVLAVPQRAPFHEQSHAAEACHGHGIGAARGFPVAVADLGFGQPGQSLVDRILIRP